jgi:hypothetical protein
MVDSAVAPAAAMVAMVVDQRNEAHALAQRRGCQIHYSTQPRLMSSECEVIAGAAAASCQLKSLRI